MLSLSHDDGLQMRPFLGEPKAEADVGSAEGARDFHPKVEGWVELRSFGAI